MWIPVPVNLPMQVSTGMPGGLLVDESEDGAA